MAVRFETVAQDEKKARREPQKAYKPSAQVQQSLTDVEDIAAQRPGAYESPYSQSLGALLNTILTRPDFHYDMESDPLYRQAREQYGILGREAMEDTMGRAAGLTGGMGSSYSQQAGQQAYTGYLQKLSEMVPKLYEKALDLYDREGQKLLEQYGLLSGLENKEYDRYSDSFSRWLQEYGLVQDRYKTDLKLDYEEYMDLLNEQQKAAAKGAR